MKTLLFGIAVLFLLTACEKPVDSAPLKVTWEDLIPPGFSPEALILKYQIDTYESDDPRRVLLIQAMEEEWNSAPANEKLDDKKVILTGFIVPLEFETSQGATKVSEFLLVPFLGACIHVPPPPANQLVYVKMRSSIPIPNDSEAVSVTGIIETEPVNSELAEAGYKMEGLYLEKFDIESTSN